MSNLSLIHSKGDFIGSLNPKAWDAVKPHTPFVFSNAFVELMVADTVKQVGAAVADRELGGKVVALSKRMAVEATGAVAASWEPDDDICPPWPWPWPGPWVQLTEPHPEPWRQHADPLPIPWKPIGAAVQIELAHVLVRLSGLTTSKEFNGELKSMAGQLVKGVAGRLADEFEKCGTVPRQMARSSGRHEMPIIHAIARRANRPASREASSPTIGATTAQKGGRVERHAPHKGRARGRKHV
jgi:hypothetical protein